MINANKPTKRTKHIDRKYFAIQDWVERDLLILHKINTQDNASDAMTKNLSKILFNRHMDLVLGRRPPTYVKNPHSPKESLATETVPSTGG